MVVLQVSEMCSCVFVVWLIVLVKSTKYVVANIMHILVNIISLNVKWFSLFILTHSYVFMNPVKLKWIINHLMDY